MTTNNTQASNQASAANANKAIDNMERTPSMTP